MNNVRLSKRIFICGAQGVGKTHISLKFVAETVARNKRVLILCPDDDEEILQPFPKIKVSEITTFKKVGRLIFDEDEPDFFEIIKSDEKGFKNGLLMVDDGQFFVTHQRNENFNRFIMRARQKNCDCLFLCHGMSNIPRSFWTFFTDLILFYTADGLNTARYNIPNFDEKYQWQKDVNEYVMESKNIRHCNWYKLQPSVYDFLKINN